MDAVSLTGLFTALAVTVVLSFAGTGLARLAALRAGHLRHPGARDSHTVPTPTGTGIAMIAVVALVPALVATRLGLPASWVQAVAPGLLIMAALGWWDDRHGVSWLPRLVVQLVVSLTLVYLLHGSVTNADFPGPALLRAVGPPVAALALVWVMNAFNFMDGSDGMAGAQAAFAGLLLAALFLAGGEPGWAMAAGLVAAAALGFLPWNLPPARVFMGDAGSVPLGLALGVLSLVGAAMGSVPWALAPLPLAVFLVDSTLTLLLRILRGERWYTAHREHLYQKLMSRGWSHGGVLALYQGINWLLVLPVAVVSTKHPELGWSLTGTLMTLLLLAWCAASLKLGKNLERP